MKWAMKRFLSDSSIKWILSLAVAIVLIIGAMLFLDTKVSHEADVRKVTILDVPEQAMRLYASAEVETGIPWVMLCAVDRAEEYVPDMARVRSVAQMFVKKGAVERGLTIAPITNAADLAGLYSNNRKVIAHIAKHALALQDVYLIIQSGRFPADGGTFSDEENGCHFSGISQARCPFAGTVTSVVDGTIKIECDNGFSVHMEGVQNVLKKQGDKLRAGDKVGETETYFLTFFYKDHFVHPFPYLLLWSKEQLK